MLNKSGRLGSQPLQCRVCGNLNRIYSKRKLEAQDMAEICSLQSRLANVIRILFLLLLGFVALQAQPSNQANDPSTRSSIEQRTSRYFESIRKSAPQELAFLLKMPKGG